MSIGPIHDSRTTPPVPSDAVCRPNVNRATPERFRPPQGTQPRAAVPTEATEHLKALRLQVGRGIEQGLPREQLISDLVGWEVTAQFGGRTPESLTTQVKAAFLEDPNLRGLADRLLIATAKNPAPQSYMGSE